MLERVAREAAPHGAQVAAELLSETARLADPGDPAHRRVITELALNLAAAGRHDRAQELCRQALADDPAADAEGAMRLCLAESLIGQGRVLEALEQAELAARSPSLSERDRAGPWGGLRWGRSTPAIKPRPWLLRPGADA